MAAFDFPNSPNTNDTHTENGISFKWDGTVWKRVSATGAQGPTGSTGSQGATGPTGAQGQKGAQAYISDAAPSSGVTAGDLWWDSDSGDFSIYFDDGSGSPSAQWVEVGSTGPTGPTGAQGAQGHQGATGSTGSQGATGPTGAQGAVGATGAQGATGSTGAQGALATINSNTNNYLITGTGTANTLQGESKLTFDASTTQLKITRDDDSNSGLYVFHNDGNECARLTQKGTGHEGTLVLKDGGTATVILDGETGSPSYINSGKFGINRTSPNHTLEVGGNVYITSNTSNANEGGGLLFQAKTGGFNTTSCAAIKGLRTSDTSSYLVFETGGTTERLRIASDGTVTVGDGNNLAADYVTTMLIDGGDNTKLSIYGGSTGTGTIAFPDGSSTSAQRMAGFIQMNHTSNDNGPRLNMGLNDTTLVHIRVPGSNRGQLEVYGNFNESDAPAIEISDGGDARKVYITNSSGDLNLLTRNAGQTKGQLKMFESGVFFHAQKDPDSTNVLQTFRAQTYRNQTGSTNPSTTPDQTLIQKGGSGTYDCFYEGNMVLEVNGGGNDHYQPVAFVPLGYDLDTSSFGGQWAGEMWIHQTGSQNPTSYGYSGYNTWATMSFKCRWDCAHWNAKPNGFWVEHYINQGRAQIGKIDASSTMSQFVIYLLPGNYRIRYNCVRGMAVHRSSSDGGSITLRDGGSMSTYSTLAYSSRNTSFDSEISPGSANQAYTT